MKVIKVLWACWRARRFSPPVEYVVRPPLAERRKVWLRNRAITALKILAIVVICFVIWLLVMSVKAAFS